MKMPEMIIGGTEDLINEQEAKQRIKARTRKMKKAGHFNEHEQPEGFDRITELFGNADAARHWLTVPNDALDGAKPLALLRKGKIARVEAAATGYLQGDFG